MGQGSDTVMAQIAGEVLRLPAESVTVVHSDTDATPYDMATLGSRSLFHMGNAVRFNHVIAAWNDGRGSAEAGLPPATLPNLMHYAYSFDGGQTFISSPT